MDNAPGAPKLMSLHLLEEITNGFSLQRKLGGGAYGNVYLGESKDGEKIAVKVLKDVLELDDEQFEKEYHNLASLDHKNIVRLVGYCHETQRECLRYNERMVFAEKTKRVLCFEYMHNGSLDNFISDQANGHDWCTRYAIIKGICEGLEYLHEKLESPMYHLDLKPANVLLDEHMTPKIADFGLSRLFGGEKTKMTKSSIGTHGYVPPEYVDAAVISIKFDIFSLGVMIIKIMTGPDGYFRSAEMSSQQFVELVHMDWMNRLQATSVYAYSIQVRKCIEIALSCVEADRHKRPSIGVIVNNLDETESSKKILDALRNGSGSPNDQRILTWSRLPFINGWFRSDTPLTSQKICPCISSDTEMLDFLKNKLVSYPLHITDNQGKVHEGTITTIGDPADGSTSKPVKPRIKIINCTKGYGIVRSIDVHTTEPWILVCEANGTISIWNHQSQKRVMFIHHRRSGELFIGTAKFIEPLKCVAVGDCEGYVHVCSYVEVDNLQEFRAHENWVNSLAVHPSEPLVLSASNDKLIKLWNWDITKDELLNNETGWQCIRTFKAHLDHVYQVRFNPRNAGSTFTSSSVSMLKIWNIHSPTPIASLDCNLRYRTMCLDYFIPSGDGQYLVTCSQYGNAEIWDLQTNTSIIKIQGLQELGCSIAVVEGPLGRPILLTVSEDNTVAFCDSTTHRYENRVNFNLGDVFDFAYIKMTKSLAIGCHDGIAIMEMDPASSTLYTSEGDSGGSNWYSTLYDSILRRLGPRVPLPT